MRKRYAWEKRTWDEYVPFLVIAAGVLLVVVIIVWKVRGDAAWESFRQEHHCAIIRRIDGTTSVGWGTTSDGKGGMVTTSSGDRVVWRCDDGIEYEKEE